jgi:DNA-binding NtrC family response regulator
MAWMTASALPFSPAAAPPPKVLIVEDDEGLAELFVYLAGTHGYAATAVGTIAEGRRRVEQGDVGVLITDMRLPDGAGLELIALARQVDPRIAIIAVTAFGSIELAVQAVRQGAYDFLTKPVEPAVFGVAIERAVEARRLRGEVEELRGALAERRVMSGIVGRSRQLADIVSLVGRVADSPSTVLIAGPSGSGKELVARALHEASRRAAGPFVAINAAAIPEGLLESELFGYVKGAFTDARAPKKGLFVEAHGGTLFLDEIGDLPLLLQAKLLRVLQEREVRPLGATRSEPIDVRVVAATHQDLRAAIAEKRFREDLFYRLAVIEIAIPPLRDRPEDILPLAEHFLRRASERAGRPIKGLSAAAAQRLMGYAWPGNARELENAIERAVALAGGEWVSPDDLPPTLARTAAPDPIAIAAERQMTLEELERAYVLHVLQRFGGNKVRAAAALGISRRTIQRWLGEGPELEGV